MSLLLPKQLSSMTPFRGKNGGVSLQLPLAQEYDAILVVCDRFSKMAHFIATMEKTLAEELVKLFRNQV